ncbi:MAG TPA: amidase family protein [Candidatus Dormibacteraeota bacterium]|nr:amidase family protein [Candidatus Dormibacteraeota bacterium]
MLRRIRRGELNELAREWHFTLDESELSEYEKLTEYIASILDRLDRRSVAIANVQAKRDIGREPQPHEDPYNAIVRWCSVSTGLEGPLTGVRVGLKDSIAIAGIPMTAGSKVLRAFIPDRDSVVTRRLLEAGAEIVATTNMDNLAFSGGGDTSAYGPTLCPFDTTRTAGGSSGGSGAALYYDGVDVTVGCDQGGSIRVPAAWCGVLGLKPTHGLVPYVGIAGIDQTFDHAGPMARTTAAAARLLQAMAGLHEADPRQRAGVPTEDYVRAVAEAPEHLRGVRIGMVAEGFGDAAGTQPAVADAVRGTAERMRELGAEVTEVSVPAHLEAGDIAFAGFIEGMTALVSGGGNGYAWAGEYWPELAIALREGLAAFGDELSPQVKLTLICGLHLRRQYFGYYYAKAQNLRPWLRAAYDQALADVDCLLMPTTPGVPHKHDPSLPLSEHVMRGWGVLSNTAPTDMTGHPALTMPAAEVDGLPVGVMLIGRHFTDAKLLAIAQTYERAVGWLPHHPGDPRSRPAAAPEVPVG